MGGLVLRFSLHPFVSQRVFGRQSLAVILHQQLGNEINALGSDVVEGFVVEIVFSNRHVSHRLNVALSGER